MRRLIGLAVCVDEAQLMLLVVARRPTRLTDVYLLVAFVAGRTGELRDDAGMLFQVVHYATVQQRNFCCLFIVISRVLPSL